jgi:putative radical SAM enzyme (TIGR03279 family)
MRDSKGVVIEEVAPKSFSEKAGIKTGDRIISLNGNYIRDIIDLMVHYNEQNNHLLIRRDSKNIPLTMESHPQGLCSLGMTFKPFKIMTCGNNCIFCFVSQLPKGLRKTLYLKDEDYRMSFLYGNYITCTNLSADNRERIVSQRLSPLYISVHCTDTGIRNKMLGSPNAGDILKDISFFAKNRIQMHTQIVLCPDYNDNNHLSKTISDLLRFYPHVASIAVVPVGLTSYRKKKIKAVEMEDAQNAIEIISRYQGRLRKKYGESIVFASDELYIKSEIPFPPVEYYDDFPQFENGVGMVPMFLRQAKKARLKDFTIENKSRFITFTGISFYPYLSRFTGLLTKSGININAVQVDNAFFGNSVTVAGLLTGRDVIKSLSDVVEKNDILLIPDVVTKEGENVFLDDVSVRDIEETLRVKAFVIESTVEGLLKAIRDASAKPL